MEELKIPVSELAKRVGVSPQSVRFWLQGRSYPGKAKAALVESALSFKLNYSGSDGPGQTVSEGLRQTDIETFMLIQQMPEELKTAFSRMAKDIVRCVKSGNQSADYGPGGATADVYGYPAGQKNSRKRA